MVESHQVQNRGVEVVHVNRFFDGPQAVFVGGSVDNARFDSGARQPRTKRPRMMFSALGVGRIVERSAAEFRRPHNQRVIQ